ncbi:MAG: dTDP-4-dehydrorhamnose reductase, partial [Solirubrobacteraceae bacterium]|nr:dTDP-4-dehydrorhamnose reductase [Solirubrobacteraceae bacterium]
MMKLLVTGAGGMLGRAVVERALGLGHDVHAATRAELDVTDAAAAQRVLRAVCPGAVVHCAAYTDVDGAESEWGRAEAVNARGAGNVAAA